MRRIGGDVPDAGHSAKVESAGQDGGPVAALCGSACRHMSLMPAGGELYFGFGEISDTKGLGELWSALEPAADASAFTAWAWIGNWIRMLPPGRTPYLALIQDRNAIMALGVLWFSPCRRRLLRVARLHLHACGLPELDSLYIECNGLLARRGAEAAAAAAFLRGLAEHPDVPRWDELVLPGIDAADNIRSQAVQLGLTIEERVMPSHYVDLASLRGKGETYLTALVSKTRRKIKAATREYESRYGALVCDLARDAVEAAAFLTELQSLHQSNWNAKGQPGAFANPQFVEFHRSFLAAQHARGGAQVARVRAGDQVVGLMYFLIRDGVVAFYQSGYKFGLLERHEIPGLVAIATAIERLSDSGYDRFEFLAGKQQYKSELGLGCRERSWIVLQRQRLGLRIERAVRHLRRRFRARLGGQPAAAASL